MKGLEASRASPSEGVKKEDKYPILEGRYSSEAVLICSIFVAILSWTDC